MSDLPVRVRIDLNARTHDGLYVPARRSLASGPVERGETVIVFEPEDGVATTATVMRCDDEWLHLDVDWDQMREIPARELGVWRDPQLAERITDGIAQADRGETVDLGGFEQYLDTRDGEDHAFGQAMRARKRGRPEDRIAEAAARAVENNRGLGQRLADIRSQPESVTPKTDIP